MWKKVALGIIITVFFLGSIGMIGWIGFQERIRLTMQSLEQNKQEEGQSADNSHVDSQAEDHTRIETRGEAEEVMRRLEGFARTLEEDNLPTE